MPRRPDFQPVFTMGQWMVSVPPKMSATGKRERLFFGQDEAKAKKFATGLRQKYHGGQRALLSTSDAALAAEAMKLLEPLGINLLEAATLIVKQHEATGGTETFRERWQRYQAQQEGHWGSVYSAQVERMENWLSSDFMDTPIARITPAMIEEELKRYSKSTRKRHTTMVNAVISERGKQRRAVKIEVLDAEQLEALLAATKEHKGERMAVALLLFAGIRPGAEEGEITRMDWEMVGEEEIYLPHAVTKTGTDRHIPITPMLRKLIKGHPKEGPAIPSGWVRRWTRIRKEAGISEKKDICRHTFASHFLAVYGEDRTKSALGHSRGSDTLFAYYRRAVTERDGRAYFGLAKGTERI